MQWLLVVSCDLKQATWLGPLPDGLLMLLRQGEDSDDDAETDEAALASAESWRPDPIDADPSRSARSRRMHDIISMLVGIYGSKELFITEYRCSKHPHPSHNT